VPRCGTPFELAQEAHVAGFDNVAIKIADGVDGYPYEYDNIARLVSELKAVGIEPWGWQYIYLDEPIDEAKRAAARVKETGCIGFIIDAESQCKNKPTQALEYCETLRELLPNTPIGLASYRYPSYHPELPWNEFRSICDFDMPQVYWQGAHNPGYQLTKSYEEFRRFTRQLPYVPIGAAYTEFDWQATPEDVKEFIYTCGSLALPSFSFWEWYDAKFILPDLWRVIADSTIITPTLDRVRVSYAYGLNIRSAPIVATNIIGGAYYGSIWTAMNRVKDSLGREWVQVGPSAYIAGWYTVRV
jgi:hypothetical protein